MLIWCNVKACWLHIATWRELVYWKKEKKTYCEVSIYYTALYLFVNMFHVFCWLNSPCLLNVPKHKIILFLERTSSWKISPLIPDPLFLYRSLSKTTCHETTLRMRFSTWFVKWSEVPTVFISRPVTLIGLFADYHRSPARHWSLRDRLPRLQQKLLCGARWNLLSARDPGTRTEKQTRTAGKPWGSFCTRHILL